VMNNIENQSEWLFETFTVSTV